MDMDTVGLRDEIIMPHIFDEVRARQNLVAPLHHILEQLEFARPQINRPVATPRGAIDEIELKDPTRSTVSRGSTDERTHGSISVGVANMEKRDPRETTELTSMRCPSTSMARRTMNSPTPSPSHRVESSRVNASKMLESCSLAIPMPVSQTSMRTAWPERRQPMRIRPLGSVYFMALLTRFRTMPLSSTALLMTDAPVGHTRMSIPFCNAPSAFSWHACLNSGSSATGESFASFECS